MTPHAALAMLIQPTLAAVGAPFVSREADCLLLAIGLQESGFLTRRQHHGPAHGYWQFEIEAVRDFLAHGDERLQRAVSESGVMLETSVLYTDLAYPAGDRAACLLARDLLWRDPAALPALGEPQAAFAYYQRNWRPGKPSWARWTAYAYPVARETLG